MLRTSQSQLKTFALQGEGSSKGIVQLAAAELFEESEALQQQRRQQGQQLDVSFEASMLEIYNEKVSNLWLCDGVARWGAAAWLSIGRLSFQVSLSCRQVPPIS